MVRVSAPKEVPLNPSLVMVNQTNGTKNQTKSFFSYEKRRKNQLRPFIEPYKNSIYTTGTIIAQIQKNNFYIPTV